MAPPLFLLRYFPGGPAALVALPLLQSGKTHPPSAHPRQRERAGVQDRPLVSSPESWDPRQHHPSGLSHHVPKPNALALPTSSGPAGPQDGARRTGIILSSVPQHLGDDDPGGPVSPPAAHPHGDLPPALVEAPQHEAADPDRSWGSGWGTASTTGFASSRCKNQTQKNCTVR